MLLYPEDLKAYGFCAESYKWFLNKYGGNPVEYETAKADLMAYEAESETGKLEWINWQTGKNIEENYEYLTKRASTSEPINEFIYTDEGTVYPTKEEAEAARKQFAVTLIHDIDTRFNVVGYERIDDENYKIISIDLSQEYDNIEKYRVVDRNANEMFVQTKQEVIELINQLDQRDFNEVYANFPIKQKFLFDGKYKAATPIE